MAEKVNIIEIDIDVSKAIKDIASSKQAILDLKKSIKELQEAEGDHSEEIAQLNANLQAETQQLRQNESITKNVIAANNANAGSINQLRAQLNVVTMQWNRLSKEERENTDAGKALSKQKLDLTNKIKAETMATGDARINVGNYTESIKEALGTTGQFVPVLGQAANGASLIGKAFTVALGPIGLVIAAIALVVSALKSFFTASEEGQNEWNKLWVVVKTVKDNIVDALSDLGEALLKPRKYLEALGKFFQDTWGNIILGAVESTIEKIKRGLNAINLGWQKFKDVFVDNTEGVKAAQNEIRINTDKINAANERLNKGLENTRKAFILTAKGLESFVNEQMREIAIAQKIEEQQARLDKSSRAALVANAKLTLDIAKLRNQIAQKENYDNEQRLKFIDEAIEKEKQIMANNLFIAQQNLSIANQRAELAKNDKETNDELARLQAEVFRVQADNFNKTKELESQKVEAIRAAAAEEKAIRDKANKERLEQLRLEAQAAIDVANAEMQAAKDLEIFNKQMADQRAAIKAVEYENQLALAQDNIFRQIELERQGLEAKRIQEEEYAASIGANVNDIREKYRQADLELERAKQEAAISLAGDFFGNIATIAGEGTAISKAAAVAETTINTYKAATGAYSALAGIPVIGPGLGVVAAAAAVAAGLANVKKILSVQIPGGGGSGASSPGISSGGQASAPTLQTGINPNVNQGIVSRQTLLNNRNQNPVVQSVLVIDEVTKKQSNINANNETSIL